MRKDLKTGMIIGVVLLIAATLGISFLSEGSLKFRLKGKFNKDVGLPFKDDTETTSKKGKSPAEKENTESKPDEKIHIVSEGETIHDIANKYYGNPLMIIKIVDGNPDLPDDYKLEPGMKLKIPEQYK